MKTFLIIIFLATTLIPGFQPMAARAEESSLPLIQFTDVPITTAIENLERMAGRNFIFGPNLFSIGSEPTMTFVWTNISAGEALSRLFKKSELAEVRDPATPVVFILRTNQSLTRFDETLLAGGTNSPANAVVPLMQFSDVPLAAALQSLLKQGRLDIALDPKIEAGWIDRTSKKFAEPPMVSFRCENLTVTQAIVTICKNYGLQVVKDPVTNTVKIRPAS